MSRKNDHRHHVNYSISSDEDGDYMNIKPKETQYHYKTSKSQKS
jgi:hypothetical protein